MVLVRKEEQKGTESVNTECVVGRWCFLPKAMPKCQLINQ